MKYSFIIKALLPILGAATFCGISEAEKLVILHTNDTHSTIDPLADGTGGVLQRKAIIDSVRKAEKNVILVDAGDVVQGTLFFKYFGGSVEYPLLDMMGYDLHILGNHEFDNGMENLSAHYKQMKNPALSANYEFIGTELEGLFQPFVIKEVEGKKIGFIGINIDPASIIAQKNFTGKFKEVIPVANEMASKLKKEQGCDLVVVVSHIGYDKVNDKTSDIELAENSEDIDLIIGGHTHTLIDPSHPEKNPSLFENQAGKKVRVVQTGKQGRYLGKLTIDLNQLPLKDGEEIKYELIPVTDRFPEETLDAGIIDFLRTYREAVDSVNNVVVGFSEYELSKAKTGGLANLTADIAYFKGKEIVDSLKRNGEEISDLDLSIMNVGGIRHHMPQGAITEGQILSTYPFSNKLVIVGVMGRDIIEAMRVSAAKGGEAISGNVRVVTDSVGNLKRVVINGKEMDPDREYILATIDYVAEGNDDLVSLARHRKIFESEEEVSIPILLWIKNQQKLGLKVAPELGSRFVVDVEEQVLRN
ncbi:MAG: bifunctional metallophosphatase/5'-nucleotidase [Muribaculaceae bacterium]|nr:bifunctional metallophosphatase/5'-nucleotidase [Muribaculaceae bacterium]